MSENSELEPQIEETTLLPSKIEHQGIVYQDKYKRIEKIHAQFHGFRKEYFVADFGEKAAVVIVKNGAVLLIRQYRLLLNGLSYEIPGGGVNENETPRDAAVRECLEETGFKCQNLKPLINFNPDLEYTKNYTHVFQEEHVEDISNNDNRYVWVSLKNCINMIFTGKISDSLSIISIFAYCTKVNNKSETII